MVNLPRLGWPAALALALFSCLATSGSAQEEDDEDLPKVRPGMVGQYEAGGKQVTRLDRDLHFRWRGSPPDRRLSAGRFSAHWQGRLFVMSPGPYVLHCYAAGDVRLSIDGKTLLHKSSATPAWMPAEAVTLDYGYHPLVIEYRGQPDAAQFGLYWSSEKFQLEPVPDRHLFHDSKDSPDERFEQGQLLARALRCAACHDAPGEQGALTAPALLKLHGNLSPDWVIQWLQQVPPSPPADQSVDFVPRRMPHLAIEKEDARAIAAYLFSVSEPAPPIEPLKKPAAKKPAKVEAEKPPMAADLSRRNKNQKKVVKKPKARTEPSATEGETLVDTIGCLACHRVGKRGNQALFGGGDLSVIADK
ncbi:MAG TPA: c-type cytochrome, partial [Pirellulales bacterium]|nr:c-type cytochrome [Pirellulales bacterium]